MDKDTLRKVVNAACLGIMPGPILRNYQAQAPKIFCPLAVEIFKQIEGVETQEEFDAAHHKGVRRIGRTLKTSRNGFLTYGQAAKPLDVFLKLLYPSPIESLYPFLHAPLDEISMEHHAREYRAEYDRVVKPKYERAWKGLPRSRLKPFSNASIISCEIYFAWQDMFRSIYGMAILADDVWTKTISGMDYSSL